MPERIDLQGVRRLLDRGAQLLDVLPEKEFAEEHLPGAINISLKKLDKETAGRLNRDAPIIVYCWDYQ